MYDGHRLLSLLRQAVRITRKRPKAAIADKGCDAGYNYVGIVEMFGTAPIISIRGWKRLILGRQTTLEALSFLPATVWKPAKKGEKKK